MNETTLAESGLAMGDIVTFASNDESTGGVLFQIHEYCDPVTPENHVKNKNGYSTVAVDANGRKIAPMKISGYVRLKPLFSFYPTSLGAKPKGKGETVLVYYYSLKHVKKVDLIDIATKYAELGNIIRDLAVKRGMPT